MKNQVLIHIKDGVITDIYSEDEINVTVLSTDDQSEDPVISFQAEITLATRGQMKSVVNKTKNQYS